MCINSTELGEKLKVPQLFLPHEPPYEVEKNLVTYLYPTAIEDPSVLAVRAVTSGSLVLAATAAEEGDSVATFSPVLRFHKVTVSAVAHATRPPLPPRRRRFTNPVDTLSLHQFEIIS